MYPKRGVAVQGKQPECLLQESSSKKKNAVFIDQVAIYVPILKTFRHAIDNKKLIMPPDRLKYSCVCNIRTLAGSLGSIKQ